MSADQPIGPPRGKRSTFGRVVLVVAVGLSGRHVDDHPELRPSDRLSGGEKEDHMTIRGETAVTDQGQVQQRFSNLRNWNVALSIIHLAQALVLVVVSGTFAIAVTSSYPEGPPGSRLPAPTSMFHLRIGWAIGAFLLLASIDHALTATVLRNLYERDLRRGINRIRWIEYSLSATIMIVLLTLYSGTTSVNALIAVMGANVAMILFGWLQEHMNSPDRATTTMLPFWFGTIVGVAPWISIFINLVGSKTIPGFVYGIVVTEAIFFFSFALNQWLQYRRKGRWSSYEYGEKTYLVLSLIAKSLLAWQIFGGSLAGS
jgi:hypothetical protein